MKTRSNNLLPKKEIANGEAHTVPDDLRKMLISAPEALAAWEDITPLARNEWICWTVSPKKPKTKSEHIKRTVEELKKGKRRPCCWVGCVHRAGKKRRAK